MEAAAQEARDARVLPPTASRTWTDVYQRTYDDEAVEIVAEEARDLAQAAQSAVGGCDHDHSAVSLRRDVQPLP